MEVVTTKFNTIKVEEVILDGKEAWDCIGSSINEDKIKEVIKACSGLRRRWHCLEKTVIAKRVLGKGVVTIGSLHVLSGDLISAYGFNYNPPFEFHAWLTLRQIPFFKVFDIGLPGVIESGLETVDTIGPVLTGRNPAIMNGIPPKWCLYTPKQFLI